jgi:hypothetical protein
MAIWCPKCSKYHDTTTAVYPCGGQPIYQRPWGELNPAPMINNQTATEIKLDRIIELLELIAKGVFKI